MALLSRIYFNAVFGGLGGLLGWMLFGVFGNKATSGSALQMLLGGAFIGGAIGFFVVSVDAIRDLLPARCSEADRALRAERGYLERLSAYGDGIYRYTQRLLEDGDNHLLFGKVIETCCPVHIIQGGRDPDVPPAVGGPS